MNWLPAWGAWPFAIAGVVGSIGVILIHLLNRRRHRVLPWGAIEFLQRAVKRKRRSIRLRDAILLTLRTLAVLLFGLALARPHYSPRDTLAGPRPIHAIIAIDNSLSMSYQTLEGSLLQRAKQAAIQLVERLPTGSYITVLPACGDDSSAAREPSVDSSEARSAIEEIEIADAATSVTEILARVNAAAKIETNLPHRIVVVTDQQATTWSDVPSADGVAELGPLQIVDVAPPQRDNTWVAAIGVQDGFAEAGTQSTIYVTIQRSGGNSVRQAEVSLLVNEQLVGSRTIELQAGASSQLVTFEHSFITTANRLVDVPIKAVVAPDRLTQDDVSYAFVPVLPRLPIVFIDQFGANEEDVQRGMRGETRAVRRLLESDREDDLRELAIDPRHITIGELDEATLEDARVVVVAGVASPRGKVDVLRKFVEDGGRLLIAAGGEFSSREWQDEAWLDGNGILPAPLTGNTTGATPAETQGKLTPALLSFESLRDSSWLRLPDTSDENLQDLYAEPLFFKWVEVDTSREFASAYRVAARLDRAGQSPLLVERAIGGGRVLFWTSGFTSDWNTMPVSNAVVMLDRLVRELVRSTIVDRSASTGARIEIELPVSARDSTVILQRPDHGIASPIASDYFDREHFGVTILDAFRRGFYQLAALSSDANGKLQSADPIWEAELAVNGDPTESDLAPVDDRPIAALAQHIDITLAHAADEIHVADVDPVSHGLWWWLALVVLGLVLGETLVLATAHRRRGSLRHTEWAT